MPVSSTISDTLRSGGSLNISAISLVLASTPPPWARVPPSSFWPAGFPLAAKDVHLGASVSFVVTCALIAFLFPVRWE